MKRMLAISSVIVLGTAAVCATAQDPPAPEESRYETRYSVAAIDDATFYSNPAYGLPELLNQVLLEPTVSVRRLNRWSISTSLIGVTKTYEATATQLHVREAYAGLSAGDFDLAVGRKMVRWGTGYAFTAAGVLDPPRVPTNPGDRLNVDEGRDMVKADWVRGSHAITAAWSSAELAPSGATVRDTTAFRYNVLYHGFDTALLAGHDRGADTFGGITFTRVVGQAWELHGEAMGRDGAAVLAGAKYTMANGMSFIGEFYTPPNTAYYRSSSVPASAGRPHYGFLYASKTRLRELPGWKEWDVSGGVVTNFDDRSYTGVVDVSRWFGKHVSAYVHAELPAGGNQTEYGATPYGSATSTGIRFQL